MVMKNSKNSTDVSKKYDNNYCRSRKEKPLNSDYYLLMLSIFFDGWFSQSWIKTVQLLVDYMFNTVEKGKERCLKGICKQKGTIINLQY